MTRITRRWVTGASLAAGLVGGAGLVARASPQAHEHHPAAPSASGYAEMGPHMKATVKAAAKPGDLERAERLVQDTRRVIERYEDYRVVVQDGYKPFLPHLPLPEYHFTNYWYGMEAGFRFNPEHPTSLLYVKEGDGYRLTGVMFTASARASLAELDSRLPLSVAQWHLHTDVCLPAEGGGGREMLRRNARFGLQGSIATREECERAGGRFRPNLFGWMVHVYPYEKRAEDVFRMPGHHGEHESHAKTEGPDPGHTHHQH